MELIRAAKLTCKHDGQAENLLEEISFSLSDTGRIGLVGDNGCGKTTLLNIINRRQTISAGDLTVKSGLRIGYLPQEVRLDEEMTTAEYLWQARDDLYRLRLKLKNCAETSVPYAQLIAEYYDRGGGEFEAFIKKVLAGFNIGENKLDVVVSRLSGGEKTKTAMARILLQSPDVMLLDEPTNHLEIASLEWLEEYLRGGTIPYIVISHDRHFLDKCANEIWELKDKGLKCFSGNYSFYKSEKEQELRRQQHQYESQQSKITRLRAAAGQRRQAAAKMEKFKHSRSVSKKGAIQKRDAGSGRSGARSSEMMRSAKAVEKRIEQMIEKERAEKPHLDRNRKISFAPDDLGNPVVLQVENLKKRFGNETILKDVRFSVSRGARFGIIGCNGSGKSTLLKIITDNLKATSGEWRWAPRANIGYFSQEHETLDNSRTILEEVLQGRDRDQTRARTILGRLNIRHDKVFQTITTLSLGERSKTALAKILLSDVNVLVLDEPTNHLELSAREALEDGLDEYTGTIIIASHDRYLLDRVVSEIYDIEKNRYYSGGYSDYSADRGALE